MRFSSRLATTLGLSRSAHHARARNEHRLIRTTRWFSVFGWMARRNGSDASRDFRGAPVIAVLTTTRRSSVAKLVTALSSLVLTKTAQRGCPLVGTALIAEESGHHARPRFA